MKAAGTKAGGTKTGGTTTDDKPSPDAIRMARLDNPKLRERDLALQLGITELDYIAAHVGDSATRIEPRVTDLLQGMEALGEVMALTRNDSAVHEKIGVYDKVVTGLKNAMVLGDDIDLRIFPEVWAHGFAVEKREGDEIRRSLQFFDAAGDAVHKIHLRPASDLQAYEALVDRLVSADQGQIVETVPVPVAAKAGHSSTTLRGDALRERWSTMTDVHQFFGILKDLDLSRREAVHLIGPDYAWPLGTDSVGAMMHGAVEKALPVMCFVGSRGCIQIHSGPIHKVAPMGPWMNVMDPTFHLHLRTDHIAEAWAVKKPTRDGHVTSLEAYDADGSMIIQWFGKRHEGKAERADWRALIDALPRAALAESSAA